MNTREMKSEFKSWRKGEKHEWLFKLLTELWEKSISEWFEIRNYFMQKFQIGEVSASELTSSVTCLAKCRALEIDGEYNEETLKKYRYAIGQVDFYFDSYEAILDLYNGKL